MIPFLLVENHLLILDEPTNGLDTQSIIFLKKNLKEIQKRGCITIVSSHNIDFLGAISDHVGVLTEKKLNILDTNSSLENQYIDLVLT